jgi:Polyketide cyclase / dehydrase and lipid transport
MNMPVSVCPAALVAAPLEDVWALLANPSSYASWWDAKTDAIVPSGPAQPGQRVYAHTYALSWRWKITTVVELVDAARHRIQLTTTLPFGIVVHNHIVCTAVDGASTRVQFG